MMKGIFVIFMAKKTSKTKVKERGRGGGDHRCISQMGEILYQGMRESLIMSTYSVTSVAEPRDFGAATAPT